ncbi:alcohol dehydrogenase catalytic domain-containing protein [Fodinisporobacter ferrooxydans]|uniref:Alcohol dehydrogenase catalytic domain-containing protein n=1 Tax=Fodinisporobacter ferrooxydans TaxID=2901836 RepID=A0ABY4CPN4_9BACL|nr:alcohol dehydrogenase catalytic domain-containing protein [Alicyclobacillaceae bacterium MYW30-H2]
MDALVWTGPRQMEFSEMERPGASPGWVVLEVKAVGICGSELSGYLGHNSLRVPPLVMGHEFSGVVVELGAGVSEEYLGQLVTANPLIACGNCKACNRGNRQLCKERKLIGVNFPGAFAQFVAVPARNCFPVTNIVDGALAEPLACSLRAVNRVRVEAGDSGIVIGAGIIGLMAMKCMRFMGASQVIAMDTNELRLEEAKAWGATHLINPKQPDAQQKIQELFPDGADCIVDAVGSERTRQQAIAAVRRGGRIVLIGLHEDPTTVPGNVIVRDEIEIYGTFCYSDFEFARAVTFVNDGFLPGGERSWLDLRPLRDGGAAFEEQVSGTARYPKIVLQP